MKTNSQLDDPVVADRVQELILQGETNTSIAQIISQEYVKVGRDAIRRFRRRHNLQTKFTSEVKITDNEASITVKESYTRLDDPDAMLLERGLDPLEWEISSCTVNTWQSVKGDDLHQLKLNLKKKITSRILPARSDGWKAPSKGKINRTKPRLVVVCADQQAPYHNKRLHELFCTWLDANRPEEGVCAGDLCDFPEISRHPDDLENDVHANECIQGGYDILRGYVAASPDTRWSLLSGNHDERLIRYVTDNARKIYDLKRASNGTEESSVLSLPFLLRLDELDVKYIEPHGPYANVQLQLSPLLAVRHGWIASKGSGTSALATLRHLGHSVIIAHTHRQSIVYETIHDINQHPETLVAAETGAMCNIDNHANKGDKNVTYTTSPDWQGGFLGVHVYPDGRFKIDTGLFVGNHLYYQGQRYN